MLRAGLFALTAIALFVYWAVAKPTAAGTAGMTEWPTVIWFSATLLLLAASIAAFGLMLGGVRVIRLALLAGFGVAVSSVANVFEDGLGMDWAFFFFMGGTLVMSVALAALGVLIAVSLHGVSRIAALIPAGTILGILLFVALGGVVLLVTWLSAAGFALSVYRGQGAPALRQ